MDLDHDCSHHYHPVGHPARAVIVQQVLTFLNRTSVTFLQIQDVLDSVYPRTFAVLAFILSGASFAASYIFIANATRLDCDEKFCQWESASRQPNTWDSLNFWACMSLPLTSMVW